MERFHARRSRGGGDARPSMWLTGSSGRTGSPPSGTKFPRTRRWTGRRPPAAASPVCKAYRVMCPRWPALSPITLSAWPPRDHLCRDRPRPQPCRAGFTMGISPPNRLTLQSCVKTNVKGVAQNGQLQPGHNCRHWPRARSAGEPTIPNVAPSARHAPSPTKIITLRIHLRLKLRQMFQVRLRHWLKRPTGLDPRF